MSRPSSFIFWLLLAATISVDVVAFSRAGSTSSYEYLGSDLLRAVICDALLASQVSVVCIWSALATNKLLWMPALSALLAATVAAALFDDSPEMFMSKCRLYLSLYGFEAALLLAALWLFRGSRYWRQRTGATVWRFSISQLLLVMTAVAVLATTLRTGPFADESKWTNIGFALSVVMMSLVSAVVWSFVWHWLLRFATTLGTALLLGFLCLCFPEVGAAGAYIIGTHYLVQAIVLSCWLGWGPILPVSVVDDAPRLKS